MKMELVFLISVAWLVTLPALGGEERADHVADRRALLEGVTQIAKPGVPGPIAVFSDAAFVVTTGRSGSDRYPVVAAARLGKGRIVAFGHGGYFSRGGLEWGETGRLVENAVKWAAGERREPRVSSWHCDELASYLRDRGMQVTAIGAGDLIAKLSEIDVLAADGSDFLGGTVVADVRAFVERGGGLLIADLGWGWQQLHPRQDLVRDHPGNRLLAPLGLVWADGYIDVIDALRPRLDERELDGCHAGRALDRLEGVAEGRQSLAPEESARAGTVVMHAVRSIPPQDTLLWPRVRRLVVSHASNLYPKPDRPLCRADVLGRLALVLRHVDERWLPLGEIGPAPGHVEFPGAVPKEAPRVAETLTLDLGVDGWASTGLYAPAGEDITVQVPGSSRGKGLWVRIGCHSDELWGLDEWRRDPAICRRVPLEQEVTRIVSPLGGLIYLEVPQGQSGRLDVTVEGAVRAPRYVHGRTTPEVWREVREHPAPWAELESSKIVLTIPSASVRKLEDPQALMSFWDGVLECYAELGTRPLPRRPERMVTDVQISAGYMHSGYPVMLHLDVADVVTSIDVLRGKKHGGVWGLWHELGHNHQQPEWTFAGTGEVTCNLFTLYVIEKISSVTPMQGPEMQGQIPSVREYIRGGADFERWKSDSFLALAMYALVQEAFGWEPFRMSFAEYRDLAPQERPGTDDEKRDQWLMRLSRACQRNLAPYFEAWGVPASQEARESVSDLEVWLPDVVKEALEERRQREGGTRDGDE
ncbi:MAG: M60 family metallopeptidase [Planctomycetota bacterium]